MAANTNIVWFRQDLRLADNPALIAAAKSGEVLPIYVLDDGNAGEWAMGPASRWWLHQSLSLLARSLGGELVVMTGDAIELIPNLVKASGAKGVYWNDCYEPWRVRRDAEIKQALGAMDCRAESFNGALLWEPQQVLKSNQEPYKVFTPYYRNGCLNQAEPRRPLGVPELKFSRKAGVDRLKVSDLNLISPSGVEGRLENHCRVGEQAAQVRLEEFLAGGLHLYDDLRDFPARKNVSGLSPHLHFGEISPNQVWHAAAPSRPVSADAASFRRELGWREFSAYLLYHFPQMPTENLRPRFDRFPWLGESEALAAWQQGATGIPLVDAGMRELWQTGLMHNRVRMIVGSFLVKNLLLDWRLGAQWFWECLVDADLASNSSGWQWVAGSGADASPFFRIFNPVVQGKKFDAAGEYVRRYVPELARVPDKYVHCPWEAPDAVLAEAGVELGVQYPKPIVSLKISRENALAALASIK